MEIPFNVERHSWAVNREFRAKKLLLFVFNKVKASIGHSVKVEEWRTSINDQHLDEVSAIYQVATVNDWLEYTRNHGIVSHACLTAKGLKMAQRLSHKDDNELERDYILQLIYAVVDGSTVEEVHSWAINKVSVLETFNSDKAIHYLIAEGYLLRGVGDGIGYELRLTTRGVRLCEDVDKEKPTEIFTSMTKIENFTINSPTNSPIAVGDQARIDIKNQQA